MWEQTLIKFIQSWHPVVWDTVMKSASWIGYPPQTKWIMIGLAIFIILLVGLKKGLWVQAATMGAYLSGNLIKFLVNRPRPEKFGIIPWHKGLEGGMRSFPAGHVEIFTALCLTTMFFLGQKYPRAKNYFYVLFIGYLILLGISRVYLGEHWPTDVLGGYLIGVAWAVIINKLNENKSNLQSHSGQQEALNKN